MLKFNNLKKIIKLLWKGLRIEIYHKKKQT